MKKLLNMISIIMITASFNANAGNTKTCSADVKVNGLVCDFCARALEKVFGKRPEVHDIKVDLDKGDVLLNFNNGKTLPDGEIDKLITDSGYNIVKITRNKCK